MAHEITLYGVNFARSARCQWTFAELGVEFKEINDGSLIGSDELRKVHPQAKIPAVLIDGEPLFESAAICTYLCDLHPDKGLVAASGTRERALHDQWVSFSLAEIEGYIWSNAKHTGFYPEEKRIAAVVATNNEEIRNGTNVLNDLLAKQDYILGDRFTVADIIIGWTINWARRMGQLDGLDHLKAYNARLLEREHCCLNPE